MKTDRQTDRHTDIQTDTDRHIGRFANVMDKPGNRVREVDTEWPHNFGLGQRWWLLVTARRSPEPTSDRLQKARIRADRIKRTCEEDLEWDKTDLRTFPSKECDCPGTLEDLTTHTRSSGHRWPSWHNTWQSLQLWQNRLGNRR